MKKFSFPRFTVVSLTLLLTSLVIVLSETGCTGEKPGCGNRHQHKVRAKKVKRMAPGMTL